MALDPKDLFDPVEGEPLRDILGHLQNANIRQGQKETNQKLHKVASLLEEQQAEARRLAALPSCPYCGGKIDGQYELCRHCKSSLSYVEGLPCKPGQEREFADALKKERQKRAKIAEERYKCQVPQFITKGHGIDHIEWRCVCNMLLTTECSKIGSMVCCPECQRELVVIGESEYEDFKKYKSETQRGAYVLISMVAVVVIIYLIIMKSVIRL